MFLPVYISNLISQLEYSGFEAYVVGGCVRNALLGLDASDYDMTTNALPEQMKEVFSSYRVIETGLKHGTLTVLSDGHPVEITTYRIDGTYADHRKPDSVSFTRRLEDDLSRRDFTVNAMAYNPKTGIIDFYNGQKDLDARLIRCVRNPETRFNEDALRILRGIRFAATYGFQIEPETAKAMHCCALHLESISAERKQEELKKILLAPYFAETVSDFHDVFCRIIPSFAACKNQWSNLIHTVSNAERNLCVRIAVLLSPFTADNALQILADLRFDRESIDTVAAVQEVQTVPKDKPGIKRAMRKYGPDTVRKQLAYLKALDTSVETSAAEAMLNAVLLHGEAYHRGMLQINGSDLKAIGITGREVGTILNKLLDEIIDETIPNDREILLTRAKILSNKKTGEI